MNISFVIPSFNDQYETIKTIRSISYQADENDEIIIVDSSHDKDLIPNLLNDLEDTIKHVYLHTPPNGIYPAQNMGISHASNEWVQIINSADYLLDGGRIAAAEAIKEFGKDNEIIVFSQMTTLNDKKVLIFRPDANSIWPHQSILVKKVVYEDFGLYDENYSYASDQIFFFSIRSKVNFIITDFTLTSYDLSGVSSNFSLKQCSEINLLSKLRGKNSIHSFMRAYVFPALSSILNSLIGRSLALRFKFWIRV